MPSYLMSEMSHVLMIITNKCQLDCNSWQQITKFLRTCNKEDQRFSHFTKSELWLPYYTIDKNVSVK